MAHGYQCRIKTAFERVYGVIFKNIHSLGSWFNDSKWFISMNFNAKLINIYVFRPIDIYTGHIWNMGFVSLVYPLLKLNYEGF